MQGNQHEILEHKKAFEDSKQCGNISTKYLNFNFHIYKARERCHHMPNFRIISNNINSIHNQ